MKKNIRGKNTSQTDRATQTGETAGIDLGDKVSRYCLLDEEGRVIEEGSFRNTESSIQKCFGQWGRTRIALETGTVGLDQPATKRLRARSDCAACTRVARYHS